VLAIPKSRILGLRPAGSSTTKTLSGERSRWTTDRDARYSIPSRLDQERKRFGKGMTGVAADRLALEVLHREEGGPVLLADLVERDDVGVEEPLEDLRLPREPDARLGDVRRRLVSRHLGLADHLQRDRLAVALVDGPVDDPHPAAADTADDPVVRDPFDGGRVQVSS
jgi:hypothetical protein